MLFVNAAGLVLINIVGRREWPATCDWKWALSPDSYFLHLELKNVGTNIVKSFVWEYQPTAATSDYEPRQYLCMMKAKPKENKTFELASPFAPVKVVSAEVKPGQSKDGQVVINRIEYGDGSTGSVKDGQF